MGKSDTKALPVANVLIINVSLLFPAGESLRAKESGSKGLEEASINSHYRFRQNYFFITEPLSYRF